MYGWQNRTTEELRWLLKKIQKDFPDTEDNILTEFYNHNPFSSFDELKAWLINKEESRNEISRQNQET